ncbi:response regulator [Paenibacillus mesophilus]|uniref:response regulator transcription factor n=1 Tax=Paenibacillus mesophilus TaxID=2582849 RepID=UPI00110F5F37|nr:response regulator [Paenibacillus mesophilus]TMV50033.1 response regulator [Paenibacillus mesophilus]
MTVYHALLVDDEFWMLEGLKKVIKRDCPEYAVTAEARDGRQAIACMEQAKPDIVITDIRMPGMDGLQLLEEMRRRGWTIPVLIVTAHSEFEYARQAVHFGAFDYILKPLNRAHIVSALSRAKAVMAPASKGRADVLETVPVTPVQGKELVEKIRQSVCETFMHDLSITDFSGQLGFNASYLSRLFKQETGKGFVQYVTERRMEAAIRMIRGGQQSITDIARQVGYADYKHFRKVFKQYTGASPKLFQMQGVEADEMVQ